ncbi:MAG: sigma-70 family RNA polymerase sigma factor [bacterium]|nr:sigma-70 family RNA polymerase sigma factor [bacterium]
MTQGSTNDARKQLENHLGLVERVVDWTSRRYRFSTEDAEELRSLVFLKLVQDDYSVLRRFRQHSSLRTYLTTVAQRVALDYRNHRWGKWRPSAAARALGEVALLLERLVARDHYPVAEAIEILRRNHRVEMSRVELAELAARLPARLPRRENVALPADLAAEERTDRALLRQEDRRGRDRAQERLRRLLADLPREDQLILQLRFEQGLPISRIAPQLSLDQRRLYRRVRRCLDGLRKGLEAHGISSKSLAAAS